ncbi:MAG TPA: cation:proton antiporter [Terriglobales bacterium]|nr:cation:proton antiporter [Terriglobales bacterium]
MASGPEHLIFELFAIFVGAKIFGEIFGRLNLAAVLGEIFAGIILGPYALAIIRPSDTIYSIAEIGAIFVLFHAGLETSPRDLIRVGSKALTVAVIGILVPFILGFLYMRVRGDNATEATFVGAAMVATSVGITARVLGDLGVLTSRTAKIIMGAAVFDDILGMVLLALVAGLASGGAIQWLHIGVLSAEAIIFAVFMLFLGSRIIRPLRTKVERLSTHNAPLIISLAICLLLSWLAAKIGMAAIIGAFFSGLMFADYSPEWELLPRATAISDFLAPYFFFTIGSRLDLSLFTGNLLIAAVVISALAVLSKLLGCGLPLLGEGLHTAVTVGIGMMPRGEVALIVALVGLNSHIVSPATYAIVVFMTAVTTVLAPPLLRFLFRDEVRESAAAALE